MSFSFLDEKIKVFISSKCGKEYEEYNILREGLKRLLEGTGFIKTYVFEDNGGSSGLIRDEYLSKIDDSNVVLFLIDNDTKELRNGILKEWMQSKNNAKKTIFLFCNDSQKDITDIQKEFQNTENGPRFAEVNNKKDFINEGYKSVINDIIRIYKEYCKNRLILKSYDEDIDGFNNSRNLLSDISQNTKFKNNISENFESVIEYFKSINKFYDKTLQIDESYLVRFIKILLNIEKYNEEVFFNIILEMTDFYIDDINKKFIEKRMKSLDFIYRDKIENAIECLNEAYNYAVEHNLDDWLLNDVLIDKRNLEKNNDLINNTFIHSTEAQKVLDDNNKIIYYPVLDRLYKEIKDSILKEVNDKLYEKPSTIKLGSSIDIILQKIGEYYIWSICYGSYTHLKIVVKLLKETFFNFYKTYNINTWGFAALKYAILDDDFKTVEYLCERHCKIISTCSNLQIYELYTMLDNIPLKFNKELLKLKTFEKIGYYLSEDYYEIVKKEINNIINDNFNNKQNVFITKQIYSTLRKNINRFQNQEIVNLLSLIEKKCLDLDETIQILRHINFDNINENTLNRIVDFIISIMEEKNLNINLSNLMILIILLRKKNNEYSKKLDILVKDKIPEFWLDYKLEIFRQKDDFCDKLTKILQDIKNRNLNSKKQFYTLSNNLNEKIIKDIIEQLELDINEEQLTNIIVTCKETLLNENAFVGDKINTLQLFIYLKYFSKNKNIKFDWDRLYKDLLDKEDVILKSKYDEFFSKITYQLLYSMWIFYKVSNENLTELFDLICSFNGNSYENIKILEYVNLLIKYYYTNDKNFYLIIIQFILKYINNDYYEVVIKNIDCIFNLIKIGYIDINSSYINILIENPNYIVKYHILKNIELYINDLDDKFNSILERYKIDNHYIIRTKAIKLLNN